MLRLAAASRKADTLLTSLWFVMASTETPIAVGFLDYGFDVGLSANTRFLTLESIEVVAWVHLEGATMKYRTG